MESSKGIETAFKFDRDITKFLAKLLCSRKVEDGVNI